jgi:hypothetical protein
MRNNALRLVLLFSCWFVWGNHSFLAAQNITKSPYSIVGVGDIIYGGNAATYAMGQSNQGFRSPFSINMLNPASYSAFITTNIEAGATLSYGKFQSLTNTNDVNNAWIAYFNFGLPISLKRGIGISFGATPYSGVGYNIVSSIKIPQDTFAIDALNYYVGRGGLTKAYVGYGMRVHKNVSVGVNGNYIWGQNTNTTQLLIPATYKMFNTNEDKVTFLKGWLWEFGAQLHDTFSVPHKNDVKEYQWVVGASITPQSNFTAEQSYLLRSLPIGSTSGIKDTIFSETGALGTVTIPMAWKAGVSFAQTDKWMLAADVRGTQWSNYKSFDRGDSLRNSMGVSLGGSYIPNAKSKNMLARTEYRVGGRYEKSNLAIKGTGVDIFSVSAGFGIPISRSMSKVNLGFEYQQRGTSENGLIQENYYRIFVGITFADKWFYRYRYD